MACPAGHGEPLPGRGQGLPANAGRIHLTDRRFASAVPGLASPTPCAGGDASRYCARSFAQLRRFIKVTVWSRRASRSTVLRQRSSPTSSSSSVMPNGSPRLSACTSKLRGRFVSAPGSSNVAGHPRASGTSRSRSRSTIRPISSHFAEPTARSSDRRGEGRAAYGDDLAHHLQHPTGRARDRQAHCPLRSEADSEGDPEAPGRLQVGARE